MKRDKQYLLACACFAAISGQSSVAWAQDQKVRPGPEGVGLEEVVVTARRVEESLQRTPVAVTAVTNATLERAQVRDVLALQAMAPSLSISPGVAQPAAANIGLRGQISTDALISVDTAVGLYLDGVYVARSSGSLLGLVDLARVEILRGPQGTLFGRNTTGGAINMISNAPTGEFGGSVKVRAGNHDALEGTFVVNVPIIGDQMALRAVYQHNEHGGYGRNTLLDRPLLDENMEFARASLSISPDGQPWNILVQGDLTSRKMSGTLWRLLSFTPTGQSASLPSLCVGPLGSLCPFGIPGDTLANYTGGKFWENRTNNAAFNRFETRGISGTLNYDVGDLTLRSITAARSLRTRSLVDVDGTPYQIVGTANAITQGQFSQEAQIVSDFGDGRLQWILGAYYFRESGLDSAGSRSLVPINIPVTFTQSYVINSSLAGYGQATYKLTDTVRITGGLRYTKDKREVQLRNRSIALSGVETCSVPAATRDDASICQATRARKFGYWSYLANLDWQASDEIFLYVKTSRAYRAGGFNTRTILPGVSGSFEPEKVVDYEIGAKADLFGRRVRLNAAAYNTDYSNIQRSIQGVTSTGVLTSLIQNAARARIRGLELELIARATPDLTISASYGYTDPKYKKFIDGVGRDLSSQPFILTPKNTIALSGDYGMQTELGRLTLHADYAYRSRAYFGAYRGASQAGYGLVGAQASLQYESGVELAVYVRNLTNKKYLNRILGSEDTSLGITAGAAGEPRTYGASLTYRF